MTRLLVASALALLAAGCATGDRGWTGSNATAFDRAEANCQQQTAAIGDSAVRRDAFARCMADQGWTPAR